MSDFDPAELERWKAAAEPSLSETEVQRWKEAVAEPKEKSFMGSLSRAAFPGSRDVMSAVQGKNEFDFPEIGTIMSGASFDERNLDFPRGERAMVDVLKKRDPSLEVARDKYDNVVVKYQGKPYSLNRSGLSEGDARDSTRDMLVQLPLARSFKVILSWSVMLDKVHINSCNVLNLIAKVPCHCQSL